MAGTSHLGWRKWRRLPHFDEAAQVQHIVFRLRDSLPRSPEGSPLSLQHAEAILDRGEGSRLLSDPRAAAIVADTLIAADTLRYDLLAWCVMPTHAHILIHQFEGWPLHRVVGEWKSISARSINRSLNVDGRVWARDYFDRVMRDERQCNATHAYIEDNPVKAGLCDRPSDWRWSSAYVGVGEGADPPNNPGGSVPSPTSPTPCGQNDDDH